jgi:hypothetical protein
MSYVIILEGPDKVLKSTLVEKIIDNYELIFHVLHYGKPPKNLKNSAETFQQETFVEMFQNILLSNKNYIIDRSHIGENVWGPLYRNYYNNNIWEIEKRYLNVFKDFNIKLFLIYLYDTNYNMWKLRDDKKGLGEMTENAYYNIVNKFSTEVDKSAITNKLKVNLNNYYMENSTLVDINLILNEIINFLNIK